MLIVNYSLLPEEEILKLPSCRSEAGATDESKPILLFENFK